MFKVTRLTQRSLMLLIIVIFSGIVSVDDSNLIKPFTGCIYALPKDKQQQLKRRMTDKPFLMDLNDLAYVRLTYWGFDDKTHMGSVIVHRELAQDILDIFAILYQHKFPIESMKLIDVFNDDDEASMAANNTSSYNYRKVTGHPGVYSQHSYGRAIDINPLQNPYVSGGVILPKLARDFSNRHHPSPGKITRNSLIYREFAKRGWDWGGNWYDVQDYQHFEKRANGEKRNPFGYQKPVA